MDPADRTCCSISRTSEQPIFGQMIGHGAANDAPPMMTICACSRKAHTANLSPLCEDRSQSRPYKLARLKYRPILGRLLSPCSCACRIILFTAPKVSPRDESLLDEEREDQDRYALDTDAAATLPPQGCPYEAPERIHYGHWVLILARRRIMENSSVVQRRSGRKIATSRDRGMTAAKNTHERLLVLHPSR